MTTPLNHGFDGLARRLSQGALALAASAALAACSGYKPPPPSPLQPNPASVAASTAWTYKLPGNVDFPLQTAVNGSQVIVADSKGNVHALQAATGTVLWQVNAGKTLKAGVGSDGTTSAVINGNNELVAIRGGNIVWRMPMASQASTTPYVAGGRIFVLAADRSVSAFDAGNGFRLWQQQARGLGEGLVLRQNSLLTSMGGALLAGISGRLVAFNPDTGAPLGEALVANTRSTNDITRMADVLAPASKVGTSLCARTFQAAVSCVDYGKGGIVWSLPGNGTYGIAGDDTLVVGADDTGNVTAWSRANGAVAWNNTTLRYRNLGAPLLAGNQVVVTDGQGFVHMLARNNGALRNRVAVDSAAITVPPVLAGNSVVVVSSKGTVSALNLQ